MQKITAIFEKRAIRSRYYYVDGPWISLELEMKVFFEKIAISCSITKWSMDFSRTGYDGFFHAVLVDGPWISLELDMKVFF